MHDLRGVGGFQCLGGFHAHSKDVLQRHRRRIELTPQRFAAHVLHGDERMAVLFAGLIDLADVGMVERRGGLRLTKEAAARVFLLS